jgi:hypothetical protein
MSDFSETTLTFDGTTSSSEQEMGKEEGLLLFYNFLTSFFLGFHEPPQTDFRHHQVNIAGKS